jgi:hypothetical protein
VVRDFLSTPSAAKVGTEGRGGGPSSLARVFLGPLIQVSLRNYVMVSSSAVAVAAEYGQDLDLVFGHRRRYGSRVLERTEDDPAHARKAGKALERLHQAGLLGGHHRDRAILVAGSASDRKITDGGLQLS